MVLKYQNTSHMYTIATTRPRHTQLHSIWTYSQCVRSSGSLATCLLTCSSVHSHTHTHCRATQAGETATCIHSKEQQNGVCVTSDIKHSSTCRYTDEKIISKHAIRLQCNNRRHRNSWRAQHSVMRVGGRGQKSVSRQGRRSGLVA